LGSWSMMERATVRPPTPESKTPIGSDPTFTPSAVADSAAAPAAGSVLDAEVMII
jgi:hypothetical protein